MAINSGDRRVQDLSRYLSRYLSRGGGTGCSKFCVQIRDRREATIITIICSPVKGGVVCLLIRKLAEVFKILRNN
jgi:hypothetical protein